MTIEVDDMLKYMDSYSKGVDTGREITSTRYEKRLYEIEQRLFSIENKLDIIIHGLKSINLEGKE